MTNEEQVKFLTVEEVARVLRVSTPTVRRLIERGALKAKRVLHQYRIEQKDLDDYLKKQ